MAFIFKLGAYRYLWNMQVKSRECESERAWDNETSKNISEHNQESVYIMKLKTNNQFQS
jgi:hypothetical protein